MKRCLSNLAQSSRTSSVQIPGMEGQVRSMSLGFGRPPGRGRQKNWAETGLGVGPRLGPNRGPNMWRDMSDRTRHTSARGRPNLGSIRPMHPISRQTSTNRDPESANTHMGHFGQHACYRCRRCSSDVGRETMNFGPMLTTSGPESTKFDRSWPGVNKDLRPQVRARSAPNLVVRLWVGAGGQLSRRDSRADVRRGGRWTI